MADDIVTRLRNAGRCLDRHICSKCDREVRDDMGCKCGCHDYPWGDAADEIERLRVALQDAWSAADMLATQLERISSGNTDVLREYDQRREEADRG